MHNFKISIIVFCFFNLISLCNAFSQKRQISGNITDINGKSIIYANIIIKNNKNFIFRYVSTVNDGSYKITVPDTLQSAVFFIEISCVGYKSIRQQILSGKNIYNFTLAEEPIDLKEVKIRNRPEIISIGDTLSYDVRSFSRAEDRSIGDVIKRLPGIIVADDGTISYNGKKIHNLFIQGDDLMDGRYGLATKAINKDMIKSVDVIEHFQPVKVLKNKVITDDVALNLVLKNENSFKLAGQATLGAGLPHQYDGILNGIIFNKKTKMLNSIKANNSGIDLRDDFSQLGTAGFVSNLSNTKPNASLSLGTAGKPDLPVGNYYINQSKMINLNNLYNLKGDLQIKSNLQFFLDRNTLNYNINSENYLDNETIKYSELQNTLNRPYTVNTNLTATVNRNDYFLNNKLSFNFEGNASNGYINYNNQNFNQNLNQKTINFSNDFNYTPAFKNSKNILDFRWYISQFNNPQQLNINKGVLADILNENLEYVGVNQYLTIPTFYNHTALAYRICNDFIIQQNYQIGIINERQQLNSTISLIQNNNYINNYSGDAGNNLNWQRDRLFANANYYINKTSWRLNLTLPLAAQSVLYRQYDYRLDSNKKQFLFNPKASLTLNLNPEDNLNLNYSHDNSIGNIYDVFRGLILTNYRSIYANDAELQEKRISQYGFGYNFKKSIIMLFASAALNYNKVSSNSILSSQLTTNGQRTLLLPYKNDQSSIDLSINLSKFIFALNTTISLNTVLSKNNFNQFINNQLYPFSNNMLKIAAKIDGKFFDALTLSYSGTGLWSVSKQKPIDGNNFNIDNKVMRFDQNFNLGCSPFNNLYFNLLGQHTYANQTDGFNINYFFVNVKARYKFTKLRMDLEFDATNLANIRNYEVFRLSSNQFLASNYHLRGRMAIFRATFNL